MSGQVGSQIKIDSGRRWLLANVRRLRVSDAEAGIVVAEIDFLGEGDEDPSTGKMVNFKRGITAYPIPGSRVYPVTGSDLKQMFAADERAHVEIGTVYPTKDVRAALYVDAFLGKHFALLGSTGTGKSTSAALILHRICDLSPEGHIVMIDPHGEYSAAFKGDGELFNVDNLAMPYWLMNFEEHCEVFVTSSGAERQRDTDILAKCLLQARAKNRAAEGLSKLTVDSPIPYTLSDLTNAIAHEMGLLNKATDTAPFMRLKGKIDELKSDPRYQFMFSGMLVAEFDVDLHQPLLPLSGQGQADLDHRRLRRAFGHRLGRGRGAVASRLRLCDLVAQRGPAPRPSRLRGGPPLHSGRQDRQRPGGAQDARADRQGRP